MPSRLAPRSISAILAFCGLAAGAPAFGQGAGLDAGRGQALFTENCALCHGPGGTGGGQGPSLAGVMNRRAGSADFGYSPALGRAGFAWDAAHLDRYLADPSAAVPGTTMPGRVEDARDRGALVAYLAVLAAPAASAEPASTGAPRETGASAVRDAAAGPLLTGRDAFGDWASDAPGLRRRILPADLPAPYESRSTSNSARVAERPAGAKPVAPAGFRVDLFAEGLQGPRILRTAPNGDVFVAETRAGRIRILRATDGAAKAERIETFAGGLAGPFGIAFHPPGSDPRWVYVAETNRVLRFPYRSGALAPEGAAEVVIRQISPTSGGHSTRDLAVSPDGSRLFVSVGSASNVAEGLDARGPAEAAAWERAHGLGAAWGAEEGRAAVLGFAPDGGARRLFATGLRNCVGLAVHPGSGDLWCSTNERDGLGDDLVPDYVTRVREGGFYGWPWYYVGDNEDPRQKGARPDLRGKVTVPDVLLQPHSASLGMVFYTGTAFPAEYRGDGFAAQHGSWNRSRRTGYKVVRIRTRDGVPTGEYEDFLTGFVRDERLVWGRPVGVAVARDGALLVSEDGNGAIWRVAPDRPGG